MTNVRLTGGKVAVPATYVLGRLGRFAGTATFAGANELTGAWVTASLRHDETAAQPLTLMTPADLRPRRPAGFLFGPRAVGWPSVLGEQSNAEKLLRKWGAVSGCGMEATGFCRPRRATRTGPTDIARLVI